MSPPPEAAVLTAVVADDEALARRRVLTLLEEQPAVRVVGRCSNGTATVNTIRATRPDLLFLDVQMPGLDGFEVLARLDPDDRPMVIFSTAYDEYALAAFEVNAVDYLLKPYADERFRDAVGRARRAFQTDRARELHADLERLLRHVSSDRASRTRTPPLASRSPVGPLRRFALPEGDEFAVVDAASVDWIEAAGDYVRLHIGDESHLLRRTMKRLERRLDPGAFLRIHRSAIVRVDRVRHVRSNDHGDYALVLGDGRSLPVGRRYRDAVLERLGVR